MKHTAHSDATPPSVLVPVTTMEEIPVLTPAEREALRMSLDSAAADIEAGKGAPYDREELRKHFKRATVSMSA